MHPTKGKGRIAEIEVLRLCVERGYRVSIPFDDDAPYDLVVERTDRSEPLQRVQCKYTRSDGKVVQVRCRATNNWSEVRYTPMMVDWIATFDATTERCYFVPAVELGDAGRTMMHLRLQPTSNGQSQGIRWASDYLDW
ncbi:MAG: group I intron-associated PD-(D/E)XK endonuclease [Ilumatobacteraceae bacterium]|nr:hypothetical protein [Ilumatobacter sp.]